MEHLPNLEVDDNYKIDVFQIDIPLRAIKFLKSTSWLANIELMIKSNNCWQNHLAIMKLRAKPFEILLYRELLMA